MGNTFSGPVADESKDIISQPDTEVSSASDPSSTSVAALDESKTPAKSVASPIKITRRSISPTMPLRQSSGIQPMSILVTGGRGLVGSAVQRAIANGAGRVNETWHFIDSSTCNLEDIEQVRAVFREKAPTHVIHLAAKVGGLYANMDKNLEFLERNMKINMNVLSCCKEFGVSKTISCLSTCIFPDAITYPINENQLHLGPPHESNFGYSHAKRMIDVFNHAYTQCSNGIFTSIIPCNVYGPQDNYHLIEGHVIPALIHKTYLAKKSGEPLLVCGTGKPLRQFIYSDDLANLIIWTLHFYDDVEPIILSVDEKDEIPISAVVQAIAEAFDYKGEIIWDSSKPDGQYKKTASNAKLRQLNPSFVFTPFKQAIKQSVDWFVENFDTARK